MSEKKKWGILIVIIIILWALFTFWQPSEENQPLGEPIKIGVITPLTGDVAYWGESSRVGIALAEQDLLNDDINVEFIIEDGELDPTVALNAAQKLVNIDRVDAIYSEFNPAAISVTSFLKDKDILHLYDAAVISPLEDTTNTYKTYLDYEVSCQKTAEVLKERGVQQVGALKVNLEFGDLCLRGIQNVFPDVAIETYNVGETDFRTSLSKLTTADMQALFNVAFQPETLTSLRNMEQLDIDAVFVGLTETITPDIVGEYSERLEGSLLFGLPVVAGDFIDRLEGEFSDQSVSNYHAAVLAYIHTKQMVNALHDCKKDLECTKDTLDKTPPESFIGFKGFENRVASFDVLVQEWSNGQLTEIN